MSRQIRQLLVTFCFFILVASCAKLPAEPLRIGINGWPGYEFIYLAKTKGFYKDAGVEVRIIEFNSLADALQSYQRGQLDGLGCTIIELLIARAESARRPVAVYVPDYSNGADTILAARSITTLAALKGKRVGFETGSLGVFMLARALNQVQLNLSDVELVSSDQLSMEADMAQGKLDAIVTYPPVGLRLESTGKYQRLFTSAQIPGEVVDVFMFDEQVLATRLNEVKKILLAFQQAQEFARMHPDEAYATMAKREGISVADFKAAITEGIILPALSDQAALLASDGKLLLALRHAETVLLQTQQITRSAWPDSAVSDAAL